MTSLLHLHVLLDISASMTGAPLESMKQGFALLTGAFASRMQRTARISVITYDSAARVLYPLTALEGLPALGRLEPGGTSGLGKALRLLGQTMPDHHPTLVYIFTDGEPTDDWEPFFAALRPRVDKVFGMACGLEIKDQFFAQMADQAFWLGDLTPDALLRAARV